MFTKRIIPCLDCKDGRVVKGTNFVDLKDAGDPVEVAAMYDKSGADELVFLDITASSDGRNTTVDLVRKVAEKVFIPFTVGGGIRTVDDFKVLLREGADKISINSAAIMDPTLISRAADKFGSQCVVVAIDAKRQEDGHWSIYKNGGRVDMNIDAVELGGARRHLLRRRVQHDLRRLPRPFFRNGEYALHRTRRRAPSRRGRWALFCRKGRLSGAVPPDEV